MGGLSGGIWLRQVSERLFRMQGRPGGGWVVHKGSYGMAPRAGGRGRPRRTRITARSSLAAAAQNPEPPRGGGPQSRRRPPNHAATASPTVDTGEAPRHRLRISQHPGRPPTMVGEAARVGVLFADAPPGLVHQEPVEDVGGFVDGGRDGLRGERGEPVGDVRVRLDAGLGPVPGVDQVEGFTPAAGGAALGAHMWVCLFMGNASLFLELFGACRNEGLQLVTHLAPGGAAGGLKTRVQALR